MFSQRFLIGLVVGLLAAAAVAPTAGATHACDPESQALCAHPEDPETQRYILDALCVRLKELGLVGDTDLCLSPPPQGVKELILWAGCEVKGTMGVSC